MWIVISVLCSLSLPVHCYNFSGGWILWAERPGNYLTLQSNLARWHSSILLRSSKMNPFLASQVTSCSNNPQDIFVTVSSQRTFFCLQMVVDKLGQFLKGKAVDLFAKCESSCGLFPRLDKTELYKVAFVSHNKFATSFSFVFLWTSNIAS